MYTVEKRTVRKTGKASIGWHLGRGYVSKWLTFTKDGVWCVMRDGKVFAEARGKAKAELIAAALNKGLKT
jgi:hypothetical protein